MLVKRIKKNWKSKIKPMLQTELKSTNSLVPRQRRYKYFDHSPLQLLFVHLCLKEIFNGEFFTGKCTGLSSI